MFKDHTLLITGGPVPSGMQSCADSCPPACARYRILSRDEKKQDDMRKRYNNPKLKFYIGDVRDSRSVAVLCAASTSSFMRRR